jgi:multidrug resistance efflux pump
MKSSDRQPIATPAGQRVEDFRFRTLPLLVWSTCAVIVLIMMVNRASHVEYVGLARAMEYEISTSSPANLETIVVDIYDSVDKGDVVAKLDDSQLLAAIRTAEASVAKLTADMQAARASLFTGAGQNTKGWATDLRRFQLDEERLRLEILTQRIGIEGSRVEAERLALRVGRARTLFDVGLMSQNDFDIVVLEHDRVQTELEEATVLLSQTEEEYREAQGRRQAFEGDLGQVPEDEPMLQPLKEAINVEMRRLEEIEVLRQATILRSPVSGQVSQILCQRGQAVEPGEPILLVTERSVREVVTYLDEQTGFEITENTPVLMAYPNGGGVLAESLVVRVSPSIQELPPRLWRNPRVPDFGRAVVIAVSPEMGLTPGQRVDVKFLNR